MGTVAAGMMEERADKSGAVNTTVQKRYEIAFLCNVCHDFVRHYDGTSASCSFA